MTHIEKINELISREPDQCNHSAPKGSVHDYILNGLDMTRSYNDTVVIKQDPFPLHRHCIDKYVRDNSRPLKSHKYKNNYRVHAFN